MNVALIGATGKVGSRILDELLSRGHMVTAIARNTDKLSGREGVMARTGDVNDALALATLIKGCEAVISAVPFRTSDPATLVKAVEAAGARRYLVVGGAGSLEVAPGVRLIDTPEFPEATARKPLPALVSSISCARRTVWTGPSCRLRPCSCPASGPAASALARTSFSQERRAARSPMRIMRLPWWTSWKASPSAPAFHCRLLRPLTSL